VAALLVVAGRAWSHRRLRLRFERLERESAMERERTRIARDIHDEIGAGLTRISFLAQGAPSGFAAEGQRSYFDQIYTATTAMTRSIDEIVWALDARHDNLDSLEFYLGNYAQGFLGVAKVRCRLNAPRPLPRVDVSSHVRHQLFMAFKEALNNCVKHAHATEVAIDIDYRDGNLVVTIADNGCGLHAGDGGAAATEARVSSGHGLENLAQRLASIGGDARIGDAKNGGAEVALTVPLGRPVL
jgi:signal transduction histidine kinase